MAKKVLIYGGRGGLGSVLVNHFKSNSWWVCSVDLAANDAADANVIVNPADEWTKQEEHVCAEVAKAVGEGDKLEAVINMAGKERTLFTTSSKVAFFRIVFVQVVGRVATPARRILSRTPT